MAKFNNTSIHVSLHCMFLQLYLYAIAHWLGFRPTCITSSYESVAKQPIFVEYILLYKKH